MSNFGLHSRIMSIDVLEACMEAGKNSFETAAEVANVTVFAVLGQRSSGDSIPVNRHEMIDFKGPK